MINVTTRIPAIECPPIMFAHRGARAHARENTIAAFKLARELGATGLETDAWLTLDGEIVLDHDGLHRRIPKRTIAEVPRRELKSHIPTLADLYEQAGSEMPLSVDVKDTAAFEQLISVASRYDALENLWACHPDMELLIEWRRKCPDVHLVNSTRLSDMSGGPERRAADLASENIDAVNLRCDEWTGGFTTLFHRFDVRTFGWDAHSEHRLAALIDMGIDAVYSDYVDRMVATVATFYSEEPDI